MINANELRIGNLIYGVSDRVETVTLIKEDNYVQAYAGMLIETVHGIELKYCSGIELTEDWLLKLGFNLTIHNRDSGYKQFGKIVCGFDFTFCIECNNEPEFSIDNKPTQSDMKHVHQLQNLYFALTGKELAYS